MKKVFALVLSLVLLLTATAMAETITLGHFGAPGEPVTSIVLPFSSTRVLPICPASGFGLPGVTPPAS